MIKAFVVPYIHDTWELPFCIIQQKDIFHTLKKMYNAKKKKNTIDKWLGYDTFNISNFLKKAVIVSL